MSEKDRSSRIEGRGEQQNNRQGPQALNKNSEETSSTKGFEHLEEQYLKRTPVVGIDAELATDDELARVALRTHHYGHDLVVAYREGAAPDLIEIEHMPNVRLRAVPKTVDENGIRRTLSSVAQVNGYPGLLYLSNPEYHINYEASLAAFASKSSFDIDAVVESENTADYGRVIVGIPAYNEESRIARVVRATWEYADEVIVVDDGSDDRTVERATEAGATVVTHRRNFGYGAALKTLFKEAKYRNAAHLVVLDGDDQHDPDDIPKLIDVQRTEKAEVVIGSRFVDEVDTEIPFYRQFGLRVINVLTNISLGIIQPSAQIRDTQCGFRAYDRHAIASLAEDGSISDRMGASTDILYHADNHGYKIKEVRTSVSYDPEETSSHHPIKHGMTLVNNIIRTTGNRRPLTGIGLPGFIGAFIGIGFGYWTVMNYITTQTFPVGLAIASMVFLLTGLLACFTSIILHTFNRRAAA